jgi:rhamnosyltransferase
LVGRLSAALAEAQRAWGDRVCVAPRHVDDASPEAKAEAATADSGPGAFVPARCLPTSGMLFALDALGPDQFFATDLFLDLVDFEWCWRLGGEGWRFVRCADIVMPHRLGEHEKRLLGITYYSCAPYRHYFQVRDTLGLLGRGYVPHRSKVRLSGVLPIKALAYPLLLDRGGERLRWMTAGLRDALRGVVGIGAAADRLGR